MTVRDAIFPADRHKLAGFDFEIKVIARIPT